MFVHGHPNCPWGFSDNMTTSAAANTGAELLFRERGYFFVCHSVGVCFQPYEKIEANQT